MEPVSLEEGVRYEAGRILQGVQNLRQGMEAQLWSEQVQGEHLIEEAVLHLLILSDYCSSVHPDHSVLGGLYLDLLSGKASALPQFVAEARQILEYPQSFIDLARANGDRYDPQTGTIFPQ